MHTFRWLRIFFGFLLDRRPRDPLRPLSFRVLVTPFDVEVTRAASHAYFAWAGLGRWQSLLHNVDWQGLFKDRWVPLTQGEFITFKRSAALLSVVEVTTRTIWWDEKMLYFEHVLTQGDQLCALGYSRGAFYGKRGRVSPTRGSIGLPSVPPFPKPGIVDFWNAGTDLLSTPIAPPLTATPRA